jgi:hypothetical protein
MPASLKKTEAIDFNCIFHPPLANLQGGGKRDV